MSFLKKLFGGFDPAPTAAEDSASIPQHFYLVVGGLRIPAEFLEVPPSADYDTKSIGYVMNGPRGGQYGLFDDAALTEWTKAGLLLTNVAGVSFRPDVLQRLEFLPSCEICLVPEPNNEHDRNAIAVWDAKRRYQVGYLPRDIAPHGALIAHKGYVFRQYRDKRTNAVLGLKLVLGPSLVLDIPDD